MLAVIKRVGEEPELVEIRDELSTYQKIVGGYIETFPFYALYPNGVVCICDDEGKLKNKPLNFVYRGDPIVGDVVFVNTCACDFTDLEDWQIKLIFQMFDC